MSGALIPPSGSSHASNNPLDLPHFTLLKRVPSKLSCRSRRKLSNVCLPQVTWGHNANLGRFTNFVNLLDMAGIAIPSGLLHCAHCFPPLRCVSSFLPQSASAVQRCTDLAV